MALSVSAHHCSCVGERIAKRAQSSAQIGCESRETPNNFAVALLLAGRFGPSSPLCECLRCARFSAPCSDAFDPTVPSEASRLSDAQKRKDSRASHEVPFTRCEDRFRHQRIRRLASIRSDSELHSPRLTLLSLSLSFSSAAASDLLCPPLHQPTALSSDPLCCLIWRTPATGAPAADPPPLLLLLLLLFSLFLDERSIGHSIGPSGCDIDGGKSSQLFAGTQE